MIRLFLFFLFCFPLVLPAAIMPVVGPEPIYPLTKLIKPLEYYQEQAPLWQKITQQSPDRADGWWNYYVAARNIRTLQGETSYDLQQIVQDAEAAIPDSFERYYLAFWESPLKSRRYDLLLLAHQIDSNRTEALHDLITYYELQDDHQKVQEYCLRWLQSSDTSPGILDWNYNMLMSVAPEGILLTQGDNDTYPAYALQNVLQVRTDIQVLNIFLLLSDTPYRDRIFQQLSIPPWVSTEDSEVDPESLYRHIFKYASRPVFLGISTADTRKFGSDSFFITGLAVRYSESDVDNVSQIVENYETRFRLDDLKYNFRQDPSQSVVDQINMNYVPSMVLLNRHYLHEGAADKAEVVQQMALQIGEKAGQQEAIAYHFALPESLPFFQSLIDIRALQKGMQPIGTQLFAGSTEVTNEAYELFLKDLLNQHKFDLLEKCKFSPVNWRALLPSGMQALSDDALFDGPGHPEDPQMPIVNISYEAATIYCDWLTTVYNQSTDRRKQFKKVRFRLPSEAEWEQAARGGHDKAPFPWGGWYMKNSKGCYLANVNPYLNVYDEQTKTFSSDQEAESPAEDDAFFPARADSYFPNDFNLYNMSGNVAEMVQEQDFTKGGSWLEPIYYAQIGNRHFQPIPSPAVGFRIFMEVLEEK